MFGARVMADHLQCNLRDSLGAGDTELDNCLAGVGRALLVWNNQLNFRGLADTIKLNNSQELGALLFRAAELASEKTTHG